MLPQSTRGRKRRATERHRVGCYAELDGTGLANMSVLTYVVVSAEQAARLVTRRSEDAAVFGEGAIRGWLPSPAAARRRTARLTGVAPDACHRRELPRVARGR